MPLGFFHLLLLGFIVWAFIVAERTGRIILSSLLVLYIVLFLSFPHLRVYLTILSLIVGLFCFVYLIYGGYAYNIRVFRHKKPHDKV